LKSLPESLKRTALYQTHVSLKARIVPFAGWEMPVQYSGILAEARAIRSNAGLFDVSHMGRLYISGPQAAGLMDWTVTANAAGLRKGRARYGLVCNQEGGIIDDVVFYRLDEEQYLLVCNAANHQQVLPWMQRWAEDRSFSVSIEDRTGATAMIAFQGPSASELLDRICDSTPSSMRPFSSISANVASSPAFIGRTGYTGEDGFEIITASEDAPHIWQSLMSQAPILSRDVLPCGLGARDVLRLEAGLPLHGNDIDAATSPLEAGLDRFVRLDKEFVGVDALRHQKEAGLSRLLVGLLVQPGSIARPGCSILSSGLSPGASENAQVGHVTSGTYSPTLDTNIAMGYVERDAASPGQKLRIDIRGRLVEAEVAPLPFYSRQK
jgi:aminomethyltransferase